tara:strand:- start:298 stop:519 length:222 start_codon:yes stop_codon:yes gene_type:complete
MKKTLLILGIALISLTSCEKSPTFEECRSGTVVSINEDIVQLRNNCSGNIKEIKTLNNNYESTGKEILLTKPW